MTDISVELTMNFRTGSLSIEMPIADTTDSIEIGSVGYDTEDHELVVTLMATETRFSGMGAVNDLLAWMEGDSQVETHYIVSDEHRNLLMGFWFASNALS